MVQRASHSADRGRLSRAASEREERCIGTVHHPLTFDCSFGLIFRNDGSELLVEGHFNPSHTPWRGIIVGGTGRWLGASGQVRETDLPGGERMTLTLVR